MRAMDQCGRGVGDDRWWHDGKGEVQNAGLDVGCTREGTSTPFWQKSNWTGISLCNGVSHEISHA